MENRKTIAVLFGGQSSEHIVSCMSAVNVAGQIDTERYLPLLIGITEDGRWLKAPSLESIKDGTWRESQIEAVILPDAVRHCALVGERGRWEEVRIDGVFPVLHGLYGEDGTVQGLLELAGIPYVGCGVLSSALAMDKLYTKIVADRLGVHQAGYESVKAEELAELERVVCRIEGRFSYPVFIKPSNAGSSRGITKAGNREELKQGLMEASRHDRKILVEEMIEGREVECAVFGGGSEPVIASGVGEILPAAEFYDFDAKYFSEDSRTLTDPELPGNAAEIIPQIAVKIFNAIDGYGLSRVDFFVKSDGEVVFNEINTMPGFTAISMYPMLWEARGISKKELVTRLIEHGLSRPGFRAGGQI